MKIKNKQNQKDRALKAYASMGAAFLAVTPQVADAQTTNLVEVGFPDITISDTPAPGAGLSTSLLYVDLETGKYAPSNFPQADVLLYNYAYPPYYASSDWATVRNVVGAVNGAAVGTDLPDGNRFYEVLNLAQGANVADGPTFPRINAAGVLGAQRYWSYAGGTFSSEGKFKPFGKPVTGFIGVKFVLNKYVSATANANAVTPPFHLGVARVTSNINAAPPLPTKTTAMITLTGKGTTSGAAFTYNPVAIGQPGGNAITAGSRPIPTLSEWGLITISLLLLSFGTVLIGRKEEMIAGASTGNFKIKGTFQRPPFFASYFKKALIGTGILAVLMGIFSIITYGGITAVDFFGTMVAGPIFAYLMHLLTAYNDKFKASRKK